MGIERLGWHSFRHAYSSLLNEYGTDVKVQQELLRHVDIRTTLNIYTTAVPECAKGEPEGGSAFAAYGNMISTRWPLKGPLHGSQNA